MDCVVICPIYKRIEDEAEVFALLNNRWKLNRYTWVFIGPERLRDYVEEVTSSLGLENVSFEVFRDEYFCGLEGYNRLCKSKELYSRFDSYEYMLVCQLDCLVFGRDLDRWISEDYSFYGAMVFDDYTEGRSMDECRYGRNGGLSLRKISDFLTCLQKRRSVPIVAYKRVSERGSSTMYKARMLCSRVLFCMSQGVLQAKINEDLFWTVCMPYIYPSILRVAAREMSVSFSIERMSPAQARTMLVNNAKIPFGCHAWGRYNKEIWLELMTENKLVDWHCDEFFNIERQGIRLKEESQGLASLLTGHERS